MRLRREPRLQKRGQVRCPIRTIAKWYEKRPRGTHNIYLFTRLRGCVRVLETHKKETDEVKREANFTYKEACKKG